MIKIPRWANWVARDKDGDLWAYEVEPFKVIGLTVWENVSNTKYRCVGGKEVMPSISWLDERAASLSECGEKENDPVNRPKHYQNKDGKDLFQKWYEQHDFDTYRHIMRAIAERYTSRYENKNGLEDLEKGIYTLQRLKEVEQAEKESDF